MNFVYRASKNYKSVENQILDLIKAELPDHIHRDTLKALYEPRANEVSFDLFIRGTADVLMSHGVADKNYMLIGDGDGGKLVNRRKHLLVPGPWLKRRLLKNQKIALLDNQIHCVGWPRLDQLLRLQAERVENKDVDGIARKPRVLWAPTHDRARRGDDQLSTSSYPEFEKYIPLLESKYEIETALHPRNRKSKKPTVDKLLDADYVISDFGTMVYEAWALGKPVIFPSWLIGDRIIEYLPGSAEALIFKKKIGLHATCIEDVIEFIDQGAGLDEKVHQFLDDYLSPEYRGCSSRRVAELLLQFSQEEYVSE
ncbi:hypothetical protein CR158_11710 [Halomonas heilongjiangensis]|uniref:CDP-glycerol--glycerophosphate glycerophosphotransferase n=1 Tax=Halomonas heilongjiangensis TaxID=1387883 RepID=A0A2N7TJG3_9GAMM|nr:hypothetical protein C1H66_15640 [Halomonas heilongjiangensis]PXX89074.1 hypothetical protein CR158_11710 [Halomonas heilongjiangensis]